ncbi:MAG TPA: CAP domain-containing protein [Kofleriaceae bacterium]
MNRAAILLLLVAACSSGAKRVGSQPSWRTGGSNNVAPVTFAPTTEPATRYNEPLQAPPHSPLGDAVLAAVKDAATAAKVNTPAPDARLFRACAELAQVVPEEGVLGYSVVEFALQRHGIIEPSPYLLVVWGDVEHPELIVDQLKPRLAEILADGATARVGIGAVKRNGDGTGAVVFALQGSGVATSPIPRSVKAGGSFTIDAVVDMRYREPELFVTREDGGTERIPIDVSKTNGFKANVACGKHTGKQQVEITASDAAGSTVLANFPVWCGVEPPLTITIEPTHDDEVVVTAEDAEKRLLALMNRDRLAAGLPALLWDDRVAAVSRAHSEDMRKTKIVAHISPTTGSAADRTRAAGIKTAVVLENVARAYGVGEAHAGLMNSPGHRANVLASSATHVGIGVVLGEEVSGRREMFLTQVFIRVPPKVEPAQAADLVRQRIDQVRPVVVNAKLQGVAQELAEGLAAGKTRDSLWPGARRKLDAMNTAYARVGSVVSAVAELDSIDGKSLVGDYKPDDIGVGIAQGNHPDIGEGAIWIVVLMAERLPSKHK